MIGIRRVTFAVAWSALLSLAVVAPASAQLEQGRLTGVVTDNQGAVLPGVTVTATSPALLGANTAVTEGNRGARAVSAGVSRVYRAWRNDLAERRLRDIGAAAFTRGLVSSASGNYEVTWVIGGRGCSECRAAAESGAIDPGPPLHQGCSCALVVRT